MSDRMATLSCLCILLFCFLRVYGQQPIATIRGPEPGTISENIGTVDVCINVSNAEQIPVGGAEIEVFVTNQGVDPATPEVDFSPQQQSLTFMPGTTSRCTSFMIINDSVVEQRESMIIRIRSSQINVDGVSDIVFLNIEDDDRLEIGFTQTQYAILESTSSFELCAQIESGQIAPNLMEISLDVFLTADGTAQNNIDFIKNLNDMYVFSNSTSRRDCTQIMIMDDDIVEANETFSVRLIAGGSSADSVIFTRQEATIIIQDNDFATVTIGPQQLTIAEGNDTMNSTLQLCVFLGGITENVQREVIVNITATELTTTGKDDFALLSNSITLPSNARLGDMRCFDILIIGDNFIETDEIFNVTISPFFPDYVGDPSSAIITVTRDGDAVCSILQNPTNGVVVVTGNTVGAMATYSCNTDFILVGPQKRECTANAGWSEQDSLCRRSCDMLTIQNGEVSTDLGVSAEGATAMYICSPEYELVMSSNLSRVCQSNGQWNGTDPICKSNCGMLPNPDNGMVTHVNGTLEGAVATYTCEPGYDFTVDSLRSRVCGDNARWFGDPPTCSVSSAGGILPVMSVLILMLLTHLLM